MGCVKGKLNSLLKHPCPVVKKIYKLRENVWRLVHHYYLFCLLSWKLVFCASGPIQSRFYINMALRNRQKCFLNWKTHISNVSALSRRKKWPNSFEICFGDKVLTSKSKITLVENISYREKYHRKYKQYISVDCSTLAELVFDSILPFFILKGVFFSFLIWISMEHKNDKILGNTEVEDYFLTWVFTPENGITIVKY